MDDNASKEFDAMGGIFSVGQITLAILIGTPIAGALLLAQNYKSLRMGSAALQSLVFGFVSTVIVFVVAFLLPENFPNMVWPLAYTIAMREGVKYLQGEVITQYESQGKKGSWAVAIGVGIGCSILVMALVFGLVFFLTAEQ